MKLHLRAFACICLFALLPAAAAGGGLALAALLGLAGAASAQPSLVLPKLRRPPLFLILLTLFAAWMALSAIWSPLSDTIQALKFILLLAAGLMFARAASADMSARRLTIAAVVSAAMVLALLLTIEAVGGMPLNRAANPDAGADWQLAGNPGRGAAVLASLMWTVLGLFVARRAWAIGALALLATGALASQFGQTANLVAFIVAAIAFAAGYAAPRAAILATTGSLAAWMLLAPFLTPVFLSGAHPAWPFSWRSRIEIWRYVCHRILDRPLFGHGLDASRADDHTIVVQGQTVGAIPLHPHSASLQIWFETGAVGAVLAAAILAAGGWSLSRAWHDNRPGAAAACGALAAIGVIANVSFGVWQEWWNATVLIAAATVAALGGHCARAARKPSWRDYPTATGSSAEH